MECNCISQRARCQVPTTAPPGSAKHSCCLAWVLCLHGSDRSWVILQWASPLVSVYLATCQFSAFFAGSSLFSSKHQDALGLNPVTSYMHSVSKCPASSFVAVNTTCALGSTILNLLILDAYLSLTPANQTCISEQV